MMGTKLNTPGQVRVIIKNLQNMHEKSPRVPPTRARRRMELEYQDWARLQGSLRGPHTSGPKGRLVG
jgi:hypothetical protein